MASLFAPAASIDSAGPQTGGSASAPRRLNDAIERWLEAERDQLPLWLPVALGAGVAVWFVLPDASFLLVQGALAAGALCLPSGGRLRHAVLLFGLTAAIGCGLIWWRAERVALPRLDRCVVTRFEADVEMVERLPARGIRRLCWPCCWLH